MPLYGVILLGPDPYGMSKAHLLAWLPLRWFHLLDTLSLARLLLMLAVQVKDIAGGYGYTHAAETVFGCAGQEITRRVNLRGIWQAAYTAGVVLPKPVATAQYWHRSLNPKKLIGVGFSRLAVRSLVPPERLASSMLDLFSPKKKHETAS